MPFIDLDAVRNPNTSPAHLRIYMEALPTLTPAGQRALAGALIENPQCPPDILDVLARWEGAGHVNIQKGVAGHSKTQESTLLKLAASPDRSVLKALAENDNATPAVLLRMTQGKTALVQSRIEYSVKSHPQVTLEILQILRQQNAQHLASFQRENQRFQAQKDQASAAYWQQFPLSAFTPAAIEKLSRNDLASLSNFGPTSAIRESAHQRGQFEKEHTVLLPEPHDGMQKLSATALLSLSRSDPDQETRDTAKQVQKDRTAAATQKQTQEYGIEH
jgi:hypothetical protein